MNKERLLKRLALEERKGGRAHAKGLRRRLNLAGVETTSEVVPTPAPVKPTASKKKKTTKKKSE